jgi:hypothetical protein
VPRAPHKRYMRLYNYRVEIQAKTQDSAHLRKSEALMEIAAPHESEPFFEVLQYLERGARLRPQHVAAACTRSPTHRGGKRKFDQSRLVIGVSW